MAQLTRLELEQIITEAKRKREKPKLSKLDFSEVDLSFMNLSEADLCETAFSGACLSGSVLRHADLRMANLLLTELVQADLMGADLSGANLYRANLHSANLTKANLNAANLGKAVLTNANLSEATLTRANLSRADLEGADFQKVRLGFTSFGDADLRSIRSLHTVTHSGPSYVDIHTINRSEGKIPEIFLRGVGASDIFITYITSLTGEAIRYYSCFISYSNKDESFSQRLHADLQQKGIRCWFAPEDIKIGDKIRPTIDQSIRLHDKLLLILSENSLNSFWVESEVEKAFEEECQRGQPVLFPVRLDEAVMETDKPWAAEIRRIRHIGDFSRWKEHDEYQKAFERLMRDLKAEG